MDSIRGRFFLEENLSRLLDMERLEDALLA